MPCRHCAGPVSPARLLQVGPDDVAKLLAARHAGSGNLGGQVFGNGLARNGLGHGPADAPGGIVLCESETGIVLPAQTGSLTLQKQYKYGKVLLWKYTKPMQSAAEQEGEAL